MGFGNDVVNVVGHRAGHQSVVADDASTLPTFINFTGVLNTNFSSGNISRSGGARPGPQLATLDPTALAQADRR